MSRKFLLSVSMLVLAAGALTATVPPVAAQTIVVADDTGVCFIPRDRILDVLALAEAKAKAEDIGCRAIDGGIQVPDISRATYGEKDA